VKTQMMYSRFSIGCCRFLVLALFCVVGTDQGSATTDIVKGVEGKSESEVTFQVSDPKLDSLWITEKNGDFIPLDTEFIDDIGQSIRLADIIDRPTILLPIYFYCPSSCSLNLSNLAKAIARSSFLPGKDYRVIALSFNDQEDYENAHIAKRNYMRLLPDNFPQQEWKFLTGTKENIMAVTDSIGYTFKEDKDGMFTHPSALVVIGKDGMIIKYVYGSFVPGDVDMAISEARNGTPALSVKRLLGFCFNYEPTESRNFFRNLKLSVLGGLGIIGFLFFLYLRKGRKTGSKQKDTQ
jgi:protein SCO1